MQRQVSAPKGGEVKAPEAPKTEIREFGEAIQYMVAQMAKRFRNQVLLELQKGTLEKFETKDSFMVDSFLDAQSGNFAKIYLTLADRVKRKMLKQFDDKRLEAMAREYTEKVNKRNRNQFYSRIEKRIGISKDELEATEGLTFQVNAFSLETYQFIRKMRDDTMQDWTSNTLRLMAEGKSLPEIMSQFDDMVEKRKGHAKMVARTQISTFNSLMSKTRARNLGIEKAVWVTSHDERVRGDPSGKYPKARPSHYWANGREFDLAEGLKFPSGEQLLPGVSVNCRCDYRMIIPKMESSED